MRKKKKINLFVSLSDDLLIEILRRLPINALRYGARNVCKKWFDITTNMILLDHASFMLQGSSYKDIVREVDVREEKGGVKLRAKYLPPSCTISAQIKCWRIKSWCNEFLLISNRHRHSLYLFNLITWQGLYLPECDTSCGGHGTPRCGAGLSFDAFKRVYKVFHVFMGPPLQCRILVLEKEVMSHVRSKWKKIKVASDMGEGNDFWAHPITIQGRFFHWNDHYSKYLVSLDMVKERFSKTLLPGSHDNHLKRQYSLFEMGGSLALFDNRSSDEAVFWILKDMQRMEWQKLHSVTMWNSLIYPPGTLVYAIKSIYPVWGVMSKRYVIFMTGGLKPKLFSYDMKNNIVKDLDIDVEVGDRWVVRSTTPCFVKRGRLA